MSGISTSIELQDRFTYPLMDMVNALNLTISAFEDMQSTAHANIDTSSIVGAREQLNKATMSLYELDNAISSLTGSNINLPMPNAPPVQEFTWQSDTTPLFVNTGIERFNQEVKLQII